VPYSPLANTDHWTAEHALVGVALTILPGTRRNGRPPLCELVHTPTVSIELILVR
jgi:hypothetical protein